VNHSFIYLQNVDHWHQTPDVRKADGKIAAVVANETIVFAKSAVNLHTD